MTTQIVTAPELMAERPKMVESIIDLIIASTISTLVETEDTYSHLHDLFICSGEDIVENYKAAKQGIELANEYPTLYSLVEEVIDNIGSDLFCDMLDTNQSDALSEVLRCFGHGVSFWDSWDCKLFQLSEDPKLKTTLDNPYVTACSILDKIAEVHPEYQSEEDETENNDFDLWLASNYSPAGEDASTGEEYYLSTNPNEYLPISLSRLKEQYNSEKDIEDDEEVEIDEPDNVTTFQIPEHYLSLIFNDDATGLEEEDIKAWEEFEQGMIANGFKGHWSYPDNQESYFTWCNDVTDIGDAVVDLQWLD